MPLGNLRHALTDTRIMGAALLGNFVLIPLLVWALLNLLPNEPVLHLGVLLVLLVPCTDWFITFTHLAGGETGRAIAFSPLSLLLQILLLPLYLWLFLGSELVVSLAHGDMLAAFTGLILAPLTLAWLTERWVARRPAQRQPRVQTLGWLPVPLLSVVIFLIAASQVALITGSLALFAPLTLVFGLYLLAAALLARGLAGPLGLPPAQGRVLAFSFGTRNSFVVLPIALALPESFELVAVVVVFQSLVELFGMLVYLWLVPRWLFPAR